MGRQFESGHLDNFGKRSKRERLLVLVTRLLPVRVRSSRPLGLIVQWLELRSTEPTMKVRPLLRPLTMGILVVAARRTANPLE